MNSSKLNILGLLLVWLVGACSPPPPRLVGDVQRATPWLPDFVAAFGELPLQNEGRVLPFSTLAAFTLYAVHGRRDVQFVTSTANGDRRTTLNPTEWLLDVWCYPAQAARYPLFRIENVKVLEQLGFSHEGQGQRFEYLSYEQLVPQGQKLQELAQQYEDKPSKHRSEVEEHVVQLFRQLLVYHRLHRLMEPLQYEFALQGEPLRAMFDNRDRVGLAAILQPAKADALRKYALAAGDAIDDPKHGNLAQLLSLLQEVAQPERGALWLPPVAAAGEADTWHSFGEIYDLAIRGAAAPAHLAMVTTLQQALLATDIVQQQQLLRSYRDAVVQAASARGEYGSVATEAYYYRANWHFHAMMTFVLGFLLAAVNWLAPRQRLLWWASMAATGLALALLVADVWLRCLVTGHPPITRLYDTFLFIGGVSALTLWLAEYWLPRRVALALAPFLGALLIFFARLFEVADGQDTMKPLQAVLLSNFWLGVHVPTMNIGYASGIAAAIAAAAWVVLRVCRLEHPEAPAAKALVRMTYGITCFSLATSVVGTILGGVWANDSWGRFWGWDPKENGALLICLSQIALLHARFSGMVRDAGVVLWAVATGMIVVFSWFHTNLLGVGLHAYGFSSALHSGVWLSYSVLGAILLVGGLDVVWRPNPAMRQQAAAVTPWPTPAE